MVIHVPFRILNDVKATVNTQHTARLYVLPPNRRNMIVIEDCKRCKNFAFPIPDFPCASYIRNHDHRHLVNTHLMWTIIHVHILINQKPTTWNTSAPKLSTTNNNRLAITDYSTFSHKLWHASEHRASEAHIVQKSEVNDNASPWQRDYLRRYLLSHETWDFFFLFASIGYIPCFIIWVYHGILRTWATMNGRCTE